MTHNTGIVATIGIHSLEFINAATNYDWLQVCHRYGNRLSLVVLSKLNENSDCKLLQPKS